MERSEVEEFVRANVSTEVFPMTEEQVDNLFDAMGKKFGWLGTIVWHQLKDATSLQSLVNVLHKRLSDR
jgi:hypothetical protein